MTARVLVIGTGQLGLMLAEAGARLGIVVDRYDPEQDRVMPGTSDLGIFLPLSELLARYTALTTEREQLPDTDIVATMLSQPYCYVGDALKTLSDRVSQKRMLQELDIPCLEWCGLAELDAARARWSDVVIKSRRGGYDGRGTWMLRRNTAAPALMQDAIVEPLIRFDRELSIVAARGAGGEVVCYPLVQNLHVAGVLRLTTVAADPVDPLHQRVAERVVGRLMDTLDYRGVMGVEFFVRDGQLLVNEVAPRVHNSGHWTQDGASICQFELHLRALLGLPLPQPEPVAVVAMANIIGRPFDRDWLQRPGTLHWYNKTARAGRKQGHVNCCAANRADLAAQLRRWADILPAGTAELEALSRQPPLLRRDPAG